MRTIKRIVVHHSASRPSTRVSTIAKWHREKAIKKGWRDKGIGYHYVITGDEKIHRTRELHEIVNGAAGANRDAIHICVTGDNTVAGWGWRKNQKLALDGHIDALHQVFGPLPVKGHNQVGTTATQCPGCKLEGVWV